MKEFRKVVNIFKRKFPEYKVSVRRVPLSYGTYGDCLCMGKHFRIRIKNTLSEDMAIDTFVHEFAHVLAWEEPGDRHGAAWGKAYSRCYRIFLKEWIEA